MTCGDRGGEDDAGNTSTGGGIEDASGPLDRWSEELALVPWLDLGKWRGHVQESIAAVKGGIPAAVGAQINRAKRQPIRGNARASSDRFAKLFGSA